MPSPVHLSSGQALELDQNYAMSGDNPALKAAATNIVPVILNHLDMLQGLQVMAAPPPPPPPAYQEPARLGERG